MSDKPNSQIQNAPTFAFARKNYMLMLIGLGVILLGYILMMGGGSDDPNVFSEDLFNFQRLTLSPLLILGGFVIEIVAILYRPKKKEQIEE
ncbi:MAG: DUF3098 domain-containing protein [Bacteroidetes bacterium HGW-Bacteroidetes-6]|jgi:hypothetical protein|nr:MAG: DUF3098 domain-containing protein [Bacteroidetes bacterium HGW-Bacteroidetes-6]